MKGIVLECNDMSAIVLEDDGTISKIKNHYYSVGQELILKEHKKIKKWVMTAASTAAAIGILTIGGYTYMQPVSYVSLDVNPSFAFCVNRFQKVVSVEAVNEDASSILDGMELKYESIENAVQQTIQKLIEKGYISNDDNGGVIIATSGTDEKIAQSLADKLEEKAQQVIDGEGKSADVEAQAVAQSKMEEAKALGVTPGKLVLVEKLADSTDTDIDMTEWLNKSVKDINKAIRENKQDQKPDDNEATTTTETTTAESQVAEGTTGEEKTTPSNQSGNNGNAKNNGNENTGNTDNTYNSTNKKTDSETTTAPSVSTTRNSNGKGNGNNKNSD